MPVMARDGAGSAWEDAGDICYALNGTLAVKSQSCDTGSSPCQYLFGFFQGESVKLY